MNGMSWRRVGGFAIAIGLAGCASLPEISRTQVVRDVDIEMQLSPEGMTVAPGDEVRWVNLRKEGVLVQIPLLDKDDLTCQSGFDNWSGGMLESVSVEPNETVSLCFKNEAEVLYNVRAQTAVGGGDIILSGVVRVEIPDER